MDRVKNKTGFDSVKTVLQKEAAEIQKLADHLNQDDKSRFKRKCAGQGTA